MFRHTIRLILLLSLFFASIAPGSAQIALGQEAPPPTIDTGDAPDSSNTQGLAMSAYPGVTANFPTTLGAATDAASGPFHANERLRYVLGQGVSGEENADSGVDNDGVNNIDPEAGVADQDGRDDGLSLPSTLTHCEPVEIDVAVTAFDVGQTFPESVYVNVWFDFDRNGQWGDQQTCNATGADPAIADEWAVRNHVLSLPAAGAHVFTLPVFLAWNEKADEDMWVRVTLSEQEAPAADGSGPATGYAFGETEDYWLESVGSPLPTATVPAHPTSVFAPASFHTLHLPYLTGPVGGGGGIDDVAQPSGDLREVDVAHLGGTGSPTPPLVVTVVGSGTAGKLSSWRLDSPAEMPVHLQDGPTVSGHNHQLHVLTPDLSPKSNRQMLVSGRILGGTLWLTTWRVQDDGSFEKLHTKGYGPNVNQYGPNPNVTVDRYSMAHRPLVVTSDEKRFQLATPVLAEDGMLRLVTWEIDGLSGQITGKYDSGDINPDAGADSDLSVVFARGNGDVEAHYAVSLSHESQNMVTYSFDVTAGGVPTLRGSTMTAMNIRNTAYFTQRAQNLVNAPLNEIGFVTALDDANDNLRFYTWEQTVQNCPGNDPCPYELSSISDDSRDDDPNTLGVQMDPPTINTIRAMLRDPIHGINWFEQNIDDLQAIASVRKVMVTIVALDAVNNGEVSLDDVVTVSAAAAAVNNTNASAMGLVAGEKITLRSLLYGNMMRSAGDATWAISEYVAGDLDAMVERMDAKAAELGMANTFHCQEGTTFSSVAYSTARDQVTLWESVYDDPLFLEFAGASSQEVCGVAPNNIGICHPINQPMTKGMSQYPKLDGHKNGGGGGLCPNDFPTVQFVPTCVSGGCLAVQATRLERPLIIAELQPSNLNGSRWSDARRLFDYGYRQIFTPDLRASSGTQGGVAFDFGLDAISDVHAVTAALTGSQQLRVCNWVTDAGTGAVAMHRCLVHEINDLPQGPRQTKATELDMVRISTLQADGDYLLGRREGNNLVLSLWRVGQRNY